jgi:hypothetical protein
MLVLQNKSKVRHVRGHDLHKMLFYAFYTLRGHEWHFLIKTMPEASQPVAGG